MGNKFNAFLFLSTLFIANYSHAQTNETYTHIADKNNSYNDATFIDLGEFNANPNANFIVRCSDGCTEKYGIKYIQSKEKWQISRLDANPIQTGKKFEIVKKNVSKQFVKDGYLQFTIPLSDMVNLCQSSVGISFTPDLTNNEEIAKDLKYGLVIFERIYDLPTQSFEMKLGSDRKLKENSAFNLLIGKKNNECYNHGENEIDFNRHEIILSFEALQPRIIDDIEVKTDPVTDARKLKTQKPNIKKPIFPKKPN